MPNDGTKIWAQKDPMIGINIETDIYKVLAIAATGGGYDLAPACTSGKINKWSFYKPIRINQMPDLTDAQIMQAHCGLTPQVLGKLKTNCNGLNGVAGTDDTKDAILAEVEEWDYTPPLNAYRTNDFDGYNHGALPSDKDWDSYSMLLSDLTAIENSDASLASTEGGANFTIDKSLKILTQFSVRLADGTGNYIGSGNDDMLPLSYAAGGGMISGEGWRIAYAVLIGSEWYLFIGRKALDASLSVTDAKNYFPPDMSSNTSAVKMLISAVNSGTKSFTMIPCLVKNAMMTFEANQLYPDRKISRVQVNSDTVIYAMPSGTKSAMLNITTSGTIPQIGRITGVKVYGSYNWVLGYVEVQVNDDGSTIYAMVVARPTAITGAGTVRLNLRYKTTASGDSYVNIPTSGSGVATYPFSANQTFSYGGVTYNGIVITAALGLNFDEDDVTTFEIV